MQAVLTVAGNSSRLYPYGGKTHKSTISLLGKPLIVYTLEALEKQGITDVVIIDSPGNGVSETLEKYTFSFPISYVTHLGARGMGEALLDAKEKLQEHFLLIHAHHVDASDILPNFLSSGGKGNTVLVKKESDLSSYGAVKLDGDRIIELEEKPQDQSQFTHKIVGFYLLNSEFIDILSQNPKHHYSFEEALSHLAKTSVVKAVQTDENVLSLKYPFHLFEIGKYLLEKADESKADTADIHKTATLQGKVIIGEHVKIMENAVIKGPCFLGDNVIVGNNAVVRQSVIVEEGSTVGSNMELKESILFSNSSTHSGYIGNSIVGNNTKIAAQFTSGNVRLDRKTVSIQTNEKKVDSKLTHLGAFIGHDVRIGIHVSTMPGVIIGNNSVVGPQTVVMQNIPDNSSFYSKFEGVVEKKAPDLRDKVSDDVILFDIDYTLFDTGKFKESDLTEFILYDEVIDVLQKLGRDVTLGIFSEGELDFQKAKLVNTMIHAHFLDDHVHIVSSKEATIGQILEKYMNNRVTLVDDKIEVLELAKSLSEKVYTIWVKRGPFAESTKSTFTPDAVVETLDEIIEVIGKRETSL